jgi:hypothetical protein
MTFDEWMLENSVALCDGPHSRADLMRESWHAAQEAMRERAALTAKEVSGYLPFVLAQGAVECEVRIRALPVE